MKRKDKQLQGIPLQPEIQQYFPCTQAAKARGQTAETRGVTEPGGLANTVSLTVAATPGGLANPALSCSAAKPGSASGTQSSMDGQQQRSPGLREALPTESMEMDLRALMQALPTRADLEAMMARLEEVHRGDLKVVQTEVEQLTARLTTEESSLASLENRVAHLEEVQSVHASYASSLQLHLEEFEDRSRRNNLRFRGISEGVGQEALQPVVLSICQQLDIPISPHDLEFERIHRSLGPRSINPNRPRDTICRFQCYAHKELISRKA